MSTDTSLSDLIFRSAEHPAALPDFITYFFQSGRHSHSGWHYGDLSRVRRMVRSSESTCPSLTCSNDKQSLPFCLIFPLHLWKSQNRIQYIRIWLTETTEKRIKHSGEQW